jgi:signal transduction histidine kinase
VADGFFFVFLGGTAWLVGRYVRGRRLESERFADRAQRVLREQDDRSRAAVAAERGRIARELHDVIAHSVSLMGVQAGAAERVLERDPARARDALRSIQVTARESVAELGRLLGVLRANEGPADLAPQPGLGALASLIDDSRRAGLSVELTVEGDGRHVPPGVELSTYRVAQEALTNVRKHAAGAPTRVLLRYGRDVLELCVVNAPASEPNGDGPGPVPGTGHGIAGMRERIALYGGSIDARPQPDGGFMVLARVPIEVAE